MAKPSEDQQDPRGSAADQTTNQNPQTQTNRRESYLAGEPGSAPELVRLMNCTSVEDVTAVPVTVILRAVIQAKNTIEDWEGTILSYLGQIEEQHARIQDLETQANEQQSVIKYLEQNRVTQTTPTPTSTVTSTKTTKLPDPEPLSDGKTPTFENWKIQIEGKFTANHDHFPTEQTKMIYVFGRTTGDAQTYLRPRYNSEEDSFVTAQEMIDHLGGIYLDPFKVKNARQNYRRLSMKPT